MATSQAAEAVNGLQTALEAANAPVERARARAEAARKSSLEAERRARELEDQGERLKVELTRRANEGQRRFASELAQLFGPSPPGKLLLELELAHPGELLPESVALIDVPLGFEENAVAEQRAWSTIRKQADACILVSELDRAVSGKTKAVLQQLREIVVHVILVLTKLDQAVREAERRGAGDPAESVEQARKIGTRRFAREVGRDPSEVLSIAVSAHEALTTDQDARRRMEAEVRKLFMLLRRERALILGSRSAGIVRSCIAAATEAEQRAERAYLERIATLEAGRRPEPEQLRRALLQAAEPLLQAAAERVQASGADIAADSVRLIQLECASSIEACRDKTELTAVASRLAQLITTGFTRARDAVRDHLAVEGDRALARIETLRSDPRGDAR